MIYKNRKMIFSTLKIYNCSYTLHNYNCVSFVNPRIIYHFPPREVENKGNAVELNPSGRQEKTIASPEPYNPIYFHLK